MKVKVRNNKTIISSEGYPTIILNEKDTKELHRRLGEILTMIPQTTSKEWVDDWTLLELTELPLTDDWTSIDMNFVTVDEFIVDGDTKPRY